MLTACGTPSLFASWVALGVDGEGQAHGKVTLADNVPGLFFNSGGARTPGGPGSTATVDADVEYEDGNWVIKGTWKDGAVRFKFSGWAFGSELLTEYAGGNLNPAQVRSKVRDAVADQHARHGSEWVKGGCMYFASFYESTNKDYPGSGVVNVVMCDQGGPGVGTAFEPWSNPDTIWVGIPDTTDPSPTPSATTDPVFDNSPYRLYRSGGTMKDNGIKVKARYNISPPTTTVSPPFPSPTSSSSPPVAPPN